MQPPRDDDPELIDVRADETLDLSRLEPWLRAHLPGLDPHARIAVRQFGGGHANLTYLLRASDVEYVLRRPPLGPVAPTSHDMAREHRVLARLHERFPLAPPSFALCTDPAVIGCRFHVMERRRGFVIRRELPAAFHARPALGRRLTEMIVDTLAELHLVDPARVGLGDLGRPDGFAVRQLAGWTRRWEAARHREHPAVDRMRDWLARDVPRPQAATLLHNDYKLDNILVDSTDPSVPVAVLDWDMATRGDPLMELGYLLGFWSEVGDDPEWVRATGMPTHHDGCLTRDEVIARYAARTGFDVEHVRWHQVFGLFKLIVILQQIYIRFLRGQTADRRFSTFGRRIDGLADKACALLP